MTATPVADPSSYLGPDPDINRLYDNVQVVLSGVPLPLVTMMAWNAIEEFYLRSTARRENVRWCLPIGACQLDFNPYSQDWLVAWILDLGGLTNPKIVLPGTLIDQNPPTGAREGWVLLALKPISIDVNLGNELWAQWFETILAGTLARLYSIPSRPWSNTQLAEYHLRRFHTGTNRARDIAQRQYTGGPGRWSFPRGFAPGRRGFGHIGPAA